MLVIGMGGNVCHLGLRKAYDCSYFPHWHTDSW